MYDKSLPGYKEVGQGNIYWSRIAKDFLQSTWDKLSPQAKEAKIAVLRRRWKSVRDSYRKELEKQFQESKSGSGSSQRVKYKFTSILEFLRPHHDYPTTEDSLPPDPPEEDAEVLAQTNSDLDTQDVCSQDQETATQDESASTPPQDTQNRSPSTRTRTNVTHRGFRASTQGRRMGRGISRAEYDEKLISSIEKAVDHMDKREEEVAKLKDPCTQYLLSLVPFLQKVPEDKQWAARLAISNALDTYLQTDRLPSEGSHHFISQPRMSGPQHHYPQYQQQRYHTHPMYDPPTYPAMHRPNIRHARHAHFPMPPPVRNEPPHSYHTSSLSHENPVYTDLNFQNTSQSSSDSTPPSFNADNTMTEFLFQQDC
ncbi:uncharacterized protein [Hyperolius riggenbachi]|uniref:uncharacterized protein n=1 Tax=Hyperolius riggenbachi TaxID=752182 RepID=UPI0035A2CEE1